jgi:hypothetical protein
MSCPRSQARIPWQPTSRGRSPASKAFYDRKRAEIKCHNATLICLARRRCDVILAMLRTGQSYRPARDAAKLADAT